MIVAIVIRNKDNAIMDCLEWPGGIGRGLLRDQWVAARYGKSVPADNFHILDRAVVSYDKLTPATPDLPPMKEVSA
jgi:hypothetical protein